MSYDGTTFRGLDDDAPGGGGVLADLPLDVFLEQAIASNSRYLAANYNAVSVPFYGLDSDTTPTATEKTWCSRNQSRQIAYPILVERGMTGVRFTMSYACTAADSENTGVNCELRISKWNTSRERGTTVASTSFTLGSQATYTDTEQTVEFSGPWTGTPQVMYVELWIQSDAAGDNGDNVTASGVGSYSFGLSATLADDTRFVSQFLRSDDTDTDYDVITANGTNLVVYPDPAGIEEDGAVLSIYEAWYLNVRSVSVRPEYNGLLRCQSPSVEELRAQVSIYSTTSLPQISAVRRAYSAPRHVAHGPAGEISPEETSAQPWYLYKREPVNEIMIDGVLQDAITGKDSLTAIINWGITGGYVETELDVTVTATYSILDDGDTSWSDATLIASRSRRDTYTFPAGLNCLTLRQLSARSVEDVIGRALCRDSSVYPGEPKQIATTVLSGMTVQATATPTRHSRPGRIQLSFVVNDSNLPTGGLPTGGSIFVTGYSIIARAL